jgi:hypothetical protein
MLSHLTQSALAPAVLPPADSYCDRTACRRLPPRPVHRGGAELRGAAPPGRHRHARRQVPRGRVAAGVDACSSDRPAPGGWGGLPGKNVTRPPSVPPPTHRPRTCPATHEPSPRSPRQRLTATAPPRSRASRSSASWGGASCGATPSWRRRWCMQCITSTARPRRTSSPAAPASPSWTSWPASRRCPRWAGHAGAVRGQLALVPRGALILNIAAVGAGNCAGPGDLGPVLAPHAHTYALPA